MRYGTTGVGERQMLYVEIHRRPDGNTLDPSTYLDSLATFAAQLPPGAAAFAADPQHYDFLARRCVKDLKPVSLTVAEIDGTRAAELRLRHNCWKHEEDLTIRYTGVRSLTANPAGIAEDVMQLGDVMLDELLPHEDGCSHEIAFLAGTLVITTVDLVATWHAAHCQ
jgi:hypothetical protein